MTICFNEIYSLTSTADWMTQPFQGFNLDSRYIAKGQIFIALTSYSQPEKTIQFAQSALDRGALAVISEMDLNLANAVTIPNVRQLMGQWQKQYLQATLPVNPARVIAVTGTNGKTTISRLIAELLMLQGKKCAVMGTTGNGILPNLEASSHTTLDALHLQNALHDYAQQGAEFASIEASSHGLEQGRLNGCDIEIAAYSNLSRDHLDYHKTLEAYAEAKSRLFAFESLKVAIINIDDEHASVMLNAARQNPAQPKILSYSTTQKADYEVRDIQYSLNGAHFKLMTAEAVFEVHSPLLGHFNIENIVASLIAAEQAGFALADLIAVTPELKGAPGRMQVIRDGERLFVVDYAHTPDALIQVLETLKRHVSKHLWAVFGCGGDRDRGKRPLMTQAALDYADVALITSDNPRTENPEQIFADMKAGIQFAGHIVHEIHDRREAIKFAVQQAQDGDIVVIAGKGHENYQEIDGVRHWFDDVVEVQSAINALQGIDSSYPAQ
ncbi:MULTISPECIES: UDP-N-acetylmuramoyl-L-alanyl-D-glutamate--2,6-diaminopimelate ligase [Acinetobacter]|jgi:UDP-N-acetylmuramoyl-L-alanyl-D-glutamate--2,6-diaminopimelate ligase|uniref:UDP-N-acetylmuramoyl-L-alanyl-D-glutamate--2,6-diaminopimelate ligase n=1 Tax=Acinetobacter chengduensis TaxID=2420890 RepID=A0ABX9TVD0_9GAMM|nr:MULTISPECIES: UDP-N-acetylmuramoyl-L-alanyl-D-glutamate--2,6-diaminopimelate ligase [Acinetobacter]MBI1451875.1 UDP-N-acetylmuramoyl-L-alanyl-D-glutamate--2,6-diaminopimelate ligase [Acinetobacter sp. FL51]RKG44209.1 UDP-N-acetylmuramoyl-L-alanyl-D-glutamate--2,6-diaminopimelate ligase [Acinetobacter sp. WCHAc060007]RLL21543.1 UDP-N-acetylmuramoyl-L-alanyl-D-glutamate--2,6-diaminopimelate ligase [Acinetobacter chengduensis]